MVYIPPNFQNQAVNSVSANIPKIEPVGQNTLYPTITETDVAKQMQTGVARDVAISQLLNPKPAGDKQYDISGLGTANNEPPKKDFINAPWDPKTGSRTDTTGWNLGGGTTGGGTTLNDYKDYYGGASDLDPLEKARADYLEAAMRGPQNVNPDVMMPDAAAAEGAIRKEYANQSNQFYENQKKELGTQKALLSRLGVLPTMTGGASAAKLSQVDLVKKQKAAADDYERWLQTRQNSYLGGLVEQARQKISQGYEDYAGQLKELQKTITDIETAEEKKGKEGLEERKFELEELKFEQEHQKMAREDYSTLAKTPNFQWSVLTPEEKDYWEFTTGYSQNFLEIISNSLKPVTKQSDWNYKLSDDGTLTYSMIDPATGQIKVLQEKLEGFPTTMKNPQMMIDKETGLPVFVDPATNQIWKPPTALEKYETTKELPTSIQEYEYAKDQGYSDNYLNFLEKKKADNEGLTTDYKNWVLMGKPEGTFGSYTTKKNFNTLDAKQQTQIDSIVRAYDSNDIVKNFAKLTEAKTMVESIAGKPELSSTDNQALIYAFAKSMDPDSVVREGEYATVQKYAQSWLESFGFNAMRVFNNQEFLTREAVNNVVDTINSKYGASKKNYQNFYNEKTGQINKKTGGIDGSDYLTNYILDSDTIEPNNNDPLGLGFNIAPSKAEKGSVEIPESSSFRTDRHNNPTAFTTDIAKSSGLIEGVDYTQGDSFVGENGKTYYTARLLKDPVDTTIDVIDNIGFYTSGGKKRWTHTAIPKSEWKKLSYNEKKNVIAKMYKAEGGSKALV